MTTRTAPDLPRLVGELRRLERELLELDYVRRADGRERIEEAVRRLGEVGTPAGILARSAETLARSSELDRVLVSRVHGEHLEPVAAWPRAGDAAAGTLAGRRVPLAYPLIEAEVARRQDAALVSVARSRRRAAPELAAGMGWEHYAVAAIRLEGRTVGLLHAGRGAGQPAVDELDLELAARYADGLARSFERALLREQMVRRRRQLEAAARWIGGQMLELAGEESVSRVPPVPSDDRRLADALTPREREILGLVARGLSNRAIASRLTLGEGTVKYHVKNILRKLQARSRTQAVSRYMRLQGDGERP